MKLVYHKNMKLPRLAWCAIAKRNSSEIHVHHGEGIEVFDNFFVEGAWDGEFLAADFSKANFFLGTGGKILDESNIIFATPNHTLERLYSIKEADILYLSNSLPFILTFSESKIDMTYLNYESDFNSILKGINSFKKYIPLHDNKKVRLHYYCNIILGNDFSIQEEKKKDIDPFNDFDDYRTSLMKIIKNITENATSAFRKVKYGLVTTISKGYDAAACAAIASEFGCDTAVTFNKPEKYADDSGEDIAIKLGYTNIIKKSADQYLENSTLVEAEFVSSGELGSGIVFTTFENEFRNNIVFVGERGDKIWDKNRTDVNKEFCFENEVIAGTSLIENRLRVGYIVLPIPLFGASEWPSIHEISNSDEMKAFSVGGGYDRPIPRRILETKGVKREMFGMEKKGAGFNYRYDNLNRINKRMSEISFNNFYNYYLNNRRKSLKVTKQWVKFLWKTRTVYINYIINKIGLNVRNKPITADAISNPGAPSYLFKWGIHEMVNRYRDALKKLENQLK